MDYVYNECSVSTAAFCPLFQVQFRSHFGTSISTTNNPYLIWICRNHPETYLSSPYPVIYVTFSLWCLDFHFLGLTETTNFLTWQKSMSPTWPVILCADCRKGIHDLSVSAYNADICNNLFMDAYLYTSVWDLMLVISGCATCGWLWYLDDLPQERLPAIHISIPSTSSSCLL